jgi:NitT/TauT family transport system substrate-binding protein
MSSIRRSTLLRGAGALTVSAALGPLAARADAPKQVLISEPQHNLGYLPLYVAMNNGYFKGIDVSVVSLPTSGSAHTDAVLTGKAWGFIGGPEHNAFADIKGANLRAIVNVVNRGNVYFVARKGLTPGSDLRAFFKGRPIATALYGGTPNSITRYLCKKLGLDVTSDVTLLEVANAAIPVVVSQGKADIAVVAEPVLSKGIDGGLWGEPFYNALRQFGPYAYSTINIPLSTITGDPTTTRAFVTGMLKGLAYIRDNHAGAQAIAAKEFPDVPPAILTASMRRSYADSLWEFSGQITPASVRTAESVVEAAGLLKQDVAYSEIIDTRYVTSPAIGAH